MAAVQIPEVPNTNNEPLQTVEAAVQWLATTVGMPLPDRATLSKLGRDCSLCARSRRRPTGVVAVIGKPWPTEKSYTADVMREVFGLHPYTRDWLDKVTS